MKYAHIEKILHDVHEAYDIHYTPVSELADVVASHLPNDTGVAPTDIHMAIWDWRMSNRVCTLVDESGNTIYRLPPWYMAVESEIMMNNQIDDTIAVAVSSMMNAVEECYEPDAARRTAETVTAKIEAAGGHAWVNPFWYGVDQIDVPTPTTRHGNVRGFEYVKWPRAQVRDVVEFEGRSWRVVANYVSPGVAGRWVRQFSFYALMPV